MKTPTKPKPIPAVRFRALLSLAMAAASGPALAAQVDNENEEVVTLPEFTVSTSSEQGYIVPNAISGGRGGERITETPFSVQALTNEFMNDFQLFEMADQLRFIAGAFSGAEDTGTNNGKTLRGF
ncbi:MAG TPA: hypothetical protein VEA63_02870, partial [Opitutus sp.]|nr:hypothetical protein [Opitutus sp.]